MSGGWMAGGRHGCWRNRLVIRWHSAYVTTSLTILVQEETLVLFGSFLAIDLEGEAD